MERSLSCVNRTVTVTTEARFQRGPDGIVRAPTFGRSYEFWVRYLDSFAAVSIIGRISESESISGFPVEGTGVRVVPVPDFVGPGGYVRRFLRIHRMIRSVVRMDSAYILRSPGLIANSVYNELRRRGIEYGVEVVGNPKEALGTIKGGFFYGPWLGQNLTRQCRNAAAVSYVTSGSLQAAYPASGNTYVTNYSSIELQEKFLAKSPRTHFTQPVQIVCVANMHRAYKGHHVLLAAFRDLTAAGVDATLALVGDGALRSKLEDLVTMYGLAFRVSFLGKLESREEIFSVLDRSDLFVLPSLSEGLPRAMIEAMARGLPCVGAKVGGIPDLLHDRYMVKPGDGHALARLIRQVIEKPGELNKMSRENLNKAREYTAEKLSKRRHRFYEFLAVNT